MLGFPRRFSWASETSEKPLKLVFYADVHARTEWDTPVAMMMAAEAINAQSPDFVIAGGDLITDGFQSSYEEVAPRWDVYMDMQEAIDAPVHVAIGNHDLVAAIPEDGSPPSHDPRKVFCDRIGVDRTYGSCAINGYHFIFLDPIQITGGKLKYVGTVWPSQLEWLKKDLESVDPDAPIVLVTHIPLLTGFYQATRGATAPAPENRVVVNSTDVLDLFADRNLQLVLQGHLHVDEMLRWGRTMFITGGAVSGKWWRGAYHDTEPGFGVVTLRGGRAEWEYVEYGWEPRRPENA